VSHRRTKGRQQICSTYSHRATPRLYQSRWFASIVSMSAYAQSDHWIAPCSSERCQAGAIHPPIPKPAARCNRSTIVRSCKRSDGRIGLVDIRDRRKRDQKHKRAGPRGYLLRACRIGSISKFRRVRSSTRAITTIWRIPITQLGQLRHRGSSNRHR
jgi:hypothetical protein